MSEEQKEKKASFCILNKIYIYIQTNVHNVHSTVCEVLHKTVKSKKSKKKKERLLVNYVKRIKHKLFMDKMEPNQTYSKAQWYFE